MKYEDRSTKIAITIFPLITLGALIGGLLFPAQTTPLVKSVNYTFMVIMFGMGSTPTSSDLGVIARRPWPVLVGILAQYIIMPLTALAVTWAFCLDPVLAADAILVGYAPGGTASSMVAYLAKGNVALSVVMTAVLALLSPLVTLTPTKYLAGQCTPVDTVAMAKSIMMIVFIPAIFGLLLRNFLPKLAKMILPVSPWISVFGIFYTIIALVGTSSTRILSAGLVALTAIITRNGLGLALGYSVARGFKVGEKTARTAAVGVGMQSSGLAAILGTIYFTPETAVPGAVFFAWYNVSGSALATFFQRRPIID